MDIAQAVLQRKSIRGYKPDPVPRAVLQEILDIARHAPSAMNTQPWQITVLGGAVLEKIRKAHMELMAAGAKEDPDLPFIPYQGIYRQRQVDLAIQIFQLMDIKREDRPRRNEWMQRGYRYFDAPAAIILSLDKCNEKILSHLDIGVMAQTICLVAMSYGLGTCIEDQGTFYPSVLRKYAGIPETSEVIISISIGYPDGDFPANRLRSTREPLEKLVTWCGFE